MKTSVIRLAIAALTSTWCCSASAQLTASRLYYGVDRPIPVRVTTPREEALSIRLLDDAGRVVAVGSVEPGTVNLATVFPDLWSGPLTEVLFAQLFVGSEAFGSSLVLQPMISPRTAVLVQPTTGAAYWIDQPTESPKAKPGDKPPAGTPSFDPKDGTVRYFSESPRPFAGLRVYTEKHVVLETSEGEMEFAMRPGAAPNTAFNFRHLVEGGFYTDVVFHRVVPVARGQPFVIQCGDPTGGGDGGPGYSIDLEQSTLSHDFGVISMARDSDPNTNGSQFFVCLSRAGTARLDGRYTAFGTLVRGAEVVRAIAATPLIAGTDRPQRPPVLKSARLIDAPARSPAVNP